MISINQEQHLFIIACGNGYTCLGFDNAFNKTEAIAREMNRPDLMPTECGTEAAYDQYREAVDTAKAEYHKTGRRLTCELTPQLVGLEGRRVEVVDQWGEKRRFNVGKSTGWIPCHLEIHNRRSTGGPAVMGAPFQRVTVIN